MSCHGLGKLGLNFKFDVFALVDAVEVDEDLLEEGVEFGRRSNQLQGEVSAVVAVLLVDVIDLAEGVLQHISFAHTQQPLQPDVCQLGTALQQLADLLQCSCRNLAFHLPVDREPEGAFA